MIRNRPSSPAAAHNVKSGEKAKAVGGIKQVDQVSSLQSLSDSGGHLIERRVPLTSDGFGAEPPM